MTEEDDDWAALQSSSAVSQRKEVRRDGWSLIFDLDTVEELRERGVHLVFMQQDDESSEFLRSPLSRTGETRMVQVNSTENVTGFRNINIRFS